MRDTLILRSMLFYSAIAHPPGSANLSNKPPVPCSHKAEDVLPKTFVLQRISAINYSTLESSWCHHLDCCLFLQLSNEEKGTCFELVSTEPANFCLLVVLTESVVVLFLIASMMASGAQKRSATARSDPLNEAGIVQRVLLSYVPRQWLFLAAVSSLWRSVYARTAATTMQTAGMQKRTFCCLQQMTLYSSVFGSLSRVQYAHAIGVDLSAASFQLAARKYGTTASLVAARELGMTYSLAVVKGVADCNTLAVMQFLHAQGCPWKRGGIACCCTKR
jgi:hypothetical protein